MKPYKSLLTSNEVLEGILNSCDLVAIDTCKLTYRSFYSGGMSSDGLCGYTFYGECGSRHITLTFYGSNTASMMHIFVQTNKKSIVRDKQLSMNDTIEFIVKYLKDFVKKGTNASK